MIDRAEIEQYFQREDMGDVEADDTLIRCDFSMDHFGLKNIKVVRTTATQIISESEERFYKLRGDILGSTSLGWTRKTYVVHTTPERIGKANEYTAYLQDRRIRLQLARIIATTTVLQLSELPLDILQSFAAAIQAAVLPKS